MSENQAICTDTVLNSDKSDVLILADETEANDSYSAPAATSRECTICLESYQKDYGILKCAHTFCFKCIETWSKTENTCPLCKTSFSYIDRISEDDKLNRRTRKNKRKRVKVKSISQARSRLQSSQLLQQDVLHHFFDAFFPFRLNGVRDLMLINRNGLLHDNEGYYESEEEDSEPEVPFDWFYQQSRTPYNTIRRRQPITINLTGEDNDAPLTSNSNQTLGVIDLTLDDEESNLNPSSSSIAANFPISYNISGNIINTSTDSKCGQECCDRNDCDETNIDIGSRSKRRRRSFNC